MWPLWLKATTAVGVGALAFLFIKPKTASAATQLPKVVPQGVADPTTGKTIVTLQDEIQAFSNVQAASDFPTAAKALYTYLKANGYDDSHNLATLVEAFQKAANTVLIGTFWKYGKLPESGVFDIVTASTLAQQTGDPLPADPSAPRPDTFAFGDNIDVNQAPLALDAAWLVMKHIQLHGNVQTDPTQMVLVRQYQIGYNTDPIYPGPGWALSAKPPTSTKLAEDGLLGPATSTQLYKNFSQAEFESSGGVMPTVPVST